MHESKAKDCLCHIALRTSSKANRYTAVQAYNYINRLEKHCHKKDLIIAGSFHMPYWAENDPLFFWQQAGHPKHGENNKGRQAININIALPRALPESENIALMEEFILGICQHPEGNLPVSYAFHNDSENNNPHFHLMLYERPIVPHAPCPTPELFFKKANRHYPERGGNKKVAFFAKVSAPKKLRKFWAKIANMYLRRNNINEHMFAESHAKRGLHILPQTHLGCKNSYLLKQGCSTTRTLANERINSLNALSPVRVICDAFKEIHTFYQTHYLITSKRATSISHAYKNYLYNSYSILQSALHDSMQMYDHYRRQAIHQNSFHRAKDISYYMLCHGIDIDLIFSCLKDDLDYYLPKALWQSDSQIQEDLFVTIEEEKEKLIQNMSWLPYVQNFPMCTETDFLNYSLEKKEETGHSAQKTEGCKLDDINSIEYPEEGFGGVCEVLANSFSEEEDQSQGLGFGY